MRHKKEIMLTPNDPHNGFAREEDVHTRHVSERLLERLETSLTEYVIHASKNTIEESIADNSVKLQTATSRIEDLLSTTPEETRLFSELLNHCQRLWPGADGATNEEELDRAKELCQSAWQQAIQVYKTQNSQPADDSSKEKKSKKPKQQQSFSLLDQLNSQSGGVGSFSLMASFVSLRDIQSAQSAEERLSVLKKIEYLEDVVQDWDSVKKVMSDGLLCDDRLGDKVMEHPETATISNGTTAQVMTAAKTSDTGVSSDETVHSRRCDYLELHVKWFQKAGESNEFRYIQTDLAEHIISLLDRYVEAPSNGDEMLVEPCFRAIHHIWMEWMLKEGVYSYSTCAPINSIGRKIFGWLVPAKINERDSSSHGRQRMDAYYAPSRRFLVTTIIKTDPCARWVAAWVAHLSPAQSLDCIRSFHDRSVGKDGDDSKAADSLRCLADIIAFCRDELVSEVDKLKQPTVRGHLLASISSILVCVRVRLFPWQSLLADAQSINEASLAGRSIHILFDLYARCLEDLERDGGDSVSLQSTSLQDICKTSISTIVAGCRVYDPSICRELEQRKLL